MSFALRNQKEAEISQKVAKKMDAVFTGKMITGQHLNLLILTEDRKIFGA